MILRVTKDVTSCPACSNPVTKLGIADRQCNTCGLQWTLDTEDVRSMLADMQMIQTKKHALKTGEPREIKGTRW